jgi:hypothetical protein
MKRKEKKEKRKRKEKEKKEKSKRKQREKKARLSGEDCTAALVLCWHGYARDHCQHAAMSITYSQAIHCIKCYKTGRERAGTFDQCEKTIR